MKKLPSLLPFAVAGLATMLMAGIGRADNLFVASNGDSSVEEIVDNQVSQFIYQSSYLNGPTGLALDSQGNLYVANNATPGAGYIAEFSSTGAFKGDVATGLAAPRGLVFDSAGDLFVAEQSSHSVAEIPAGGGAPVTVATGLGFTNGLAFDSHGDLFVTSGITNTVDKITFSGSVATTTPFISSGLTNPNGVMVVSSGKLAGDILVVDENSSQVLAYDANGNLLPSNPFIFDSNSNDGPKYIAVDTAGDFYVTDAIDDKVTEYGPDGSLIRVFTTDVDGNKAFVGACEIVSAAGLVVPEPTTWALMAGGMAMLFLVSRRRQRVLA